MLLDNLINHLTDLKQIHGGKLHIKLEFYDDEVGYHLDEAVTVIKQEDRIHIRNF